jgi:hypothetical protein
MKPGKFGTESIIEIKIDIWNHVGDSYDVSVEDLERRGATFEETMNWIRTQVSKKIQGVSWAELLLKYPCLTVDGSTIPEPEEE